MLTKSIIIKDNIRGEIIKVSKLTKQLAFERAWQIAKDRCTAYRHQGKQVVIVIKVEGKDSVINIVDTCNYHID